MYFPDRSRTPPADAGLSEAEEVTIETADGEKLIAWHVPPAAGKPVVLYFHGNGGALVHRVRRFRGLIASGNGLVALTYRGYGGSSGTLKDSFRYDERVGRVTAPVLVLHGDRDRSVPDVYGERLYE